MRTKGQLSGDASVTRMFPHVNKNYMSNLERRVAQHIP